MNATLLEWHNELQRRLARAQVLVSLGVPDPSFELLMFEVYRLRAQLIAAGAPITGLDRRAAA